MINTNNKTTHIRELTDLTEEQRYMETKCEYYNLIVTTLYLDYFTELS